MYTQCPQCRTIFEISEDALQTSLGIVRCGHCAERFDALRTLSDTLPAGPEAALVEHDPDALAPTLTSAVSPEAVQAAAKPSRKSAKAGSPAGQSAMAQPDEAWFDTLQGDRAHALIADAAGIPPDAVPSDPAWQLAGLPIQTSFAELDIIPMAAGKPVADNGFPHAIAPAPNVEVAESEPFTDGWGLDVPDVNVSEAAPSDPPGVDAEPVVPAGSLPEFVGDADSAGAPAAAGTQSDPDSWLPEDELHAGDGPAPDASIPLEEESALAERNEGLGGGPQSAESAEPVYVPPRRRRTRRSEWLWAMGCALLALVLIAQVAWASRVALVRHPTTQAQALQICMRFDCRLPPIRDIAKLELLSRDVRPDPDAIGALAITATFRNNAPYRQPWPIVVVELTDLDNDVVAMRRFRPVEYMPDAARRAAGIAAGTTVAVAFEVADPGRRAVSFHFGFD